MHSKATDEKKVHDFEGEWGEEFEERKGWGRL